MSLLRYILSSSNKIRASLFRTLDNPNPVGSSSDDGFGISTAISGDYVAIGAYSEDEPSYSNSGKVYIFRISDGVLIKTLNNPNASQTPAFDYFGISVAMSNNYLAVGSMNEDPSDCGRVYVYRTSDWVLERTLNAEDYYNNSYVYQMGRNIKILGQYVFTSVSLWDEYYEYTTDHILMYNITNGFLISIFHGDPFVNGVLESTLSFDVFNDKIIFGVMATDANQNIIRKANIYNISTGNFVRTLQTFTQSYTLSVAITDKYSVVSKTLGTQTGTVYISDTISGNLLTTIYRPHPLGGSGTDSFGYLVKILDEYVFISAPTGGNSAGGLIYIYKIKTGSEIQTIINPNGYGTASADYFGYDMCISDGYMSAGNRFEDDAGGLSSGKTYVFKIS